MSKTLLEAIKDQILIGDGAMGTQLQFAGLESGGCGEHWNVSKPDKVVAIQRGYVEAGSNVLITNTFGGSRIMLNRHDLGEETVAINQAGVRVAREAFGDKEGYVLGDIGPFGGLMEPLGDVSEQEVREAFQEQAEALVSAGADAIIVETQTSFEEAAIGIEAAKKAGAPCVIVSFAFDVTRDGEEIRTMMGIDPNQAAEFAQREGADIAGINCGSGVDMKWAANATRRYREECGLPIMAQPNAGLPELIDMKVVYRQTPEEMVDDLPAVIEAGASIIGACCGSTPAHIAALRAKVGERAKG